MSEHPFIGLTAILFGAIILAVILAQLTYRSPYPPMTRSPVRFDDGWSLAEIVHALSLTRPVERITNEPFGWDQVAACVYYADGKQPPTDTFLMPRAEPLPWIK